MDETSWRFAQIVMWLIGAQSTILGGAFIFLWNNLSKKISDLDTKIDTQGIHFDMKMDKQTANFDLKISDLSAKMDKQGTDFDLKLSSVLHLVNDIDKRLYGIETVLHMKDYCVLKQDQSLKKVE